MKRSQLALDERTTAIVSRAAGSPLVSAVPAGGGSIAYSLQLEFQSGNRAFLKTGVERPGIFACEAHGLEELRKTNAIRVPEVLAVDENFILLELIETSRPSNPGAFFRMFGERFAALHRTTGKVFGFYEDNFIGLTPQANNTAGTPLRWHEFYFEYRLKPQYDMACDNGYNSGALSTLFSKVETKLEELIGSPEEPPTLLHGDLWSGNFVCDTSEQPVIIDPAVYYGHREADLAMTKLFGGFTPEFYLAYLEAFPLAPGWQQREDIYKLYHVMNHLNLFGTGYYGQTISILTRYCR